MVDRIQSLSLSISLLVLGAGCPLQVLAQNYELFEDDPMADSDLFDEGDAFESPAEESSETDQASVYDD